MTRNLKKAIQYGLQAYSHIYKKELSKKCYYNKFIRKLEFISYCCMPIIAFSDTSVTVNVNLNNDQFSINYDYDIPNCVVLIKHEGNNYCIATTDFLHIKKEFDKMTRQ
jgi:hypothetical protein